MTSWNDPDQWAGLVDGSACPVCRRGQALDIVFELEATWVTMPERAPARGYVCLVNKTHAVELHDLTEAEGAAFMRDARRVSRALSETTGAIKLNYEVHGNSLPHLHLHLFPRYRGDRFENRPIDPREVEPPPYAEGQFAALRRRLVQRLAEGSASE